VTIALVVAAIIAEFTEGAGSWSAIGFAIAATVASIVLVCVEGVRKP